MIKKLPHKGINQPSSTPKRPMKEPSRKERAMLTDTEKKELVEELAEAIYRHSPSVLTINGRKATWEQYREHVTATHRHELFAGETALDQATACLPIIERLLAERESLATDWPAFARKLLKEEAEYAARDTGKEQGHERRV